jgi:hypothetical protein
MAREPTTPRSAYWRALYGNDLFGRSDFEHGAFGARAVTLIP